MLVLWGSTGIHFELGSRFFSLFFSQGYFYSFLSGNKHPSSSSRVCPWHRTWNNSFITKQACTECRTLKLFFLNSAPELTPLERNVKTFVLSPKSSKSLMEEFCLSENCNSSFLVSSYLWLFLADQNALEYYKIFFWMIGPYF